MPSLTLVKATPFSLEEQGLFACYQAAGSGAVSGERAVLPVLRLLVQSRHEASGPSEEQQTDEPVAEALGPLAPASRTSRLRRCDTEGS